MTKDNDVERFPLREDLPPEIAAISLPGDEDDDEPTIIVNLHETRARNAFRYLRPHILIPVLLGWAAERMRNMASEHPLASAATGIVLASTAAAVGTTAMTDRQPPAAQRVIVVSPPPVPAVTHTVTATPDEPKWTVPPAETEKPPQPPPSARSTLREPPPDPEPAPAPTRSRTQRPTQTSEPRPSRSSTPETVLRSVVPARSTDPPRPEPVDSDSPPPAAQTSAPPTTAEPEPGGGQPTIAAADCDGLVRVDLDPLDVCLLG